MNSLIVQPNFLYLITAINHVVCAAIYLGECEAAGPAAIQNIPCSPNSVKEEAEDEDDGSVMWQGGAGSSGEAT